MSRIYVGALSGTSVDAIDVIAAAFSRKKISIIGWHTEALSSEIKQLINRLQADTVSISELARLDAQLGARFAMAINQLLINVSLTAERISGIGLHGQTILHQPASQPPFTLQVGDPNIVAMKTACVTVADFRRADIAAGGQGAPLSCAFHDCFLATPDRHRVIINIGGIANVTILVPHRATTGFDCGPGNVLLDNWAQRHIGQNCDHNGVWAASAPEHDAMLLKEFLEDDFLREAPPKSTCTSHFNSKWLDRKLSQKKRYARLDPAVVQATLSELTATCIVESVLQHAEDTQEAFICGGGANNKDLMQRICSRLNIDVATTDALGIPADWVEAVAFAWLAKRRLSGQPAHIPSVTGASERIMLGGIYHPAWK